MKITPLCTDWVEYLWSLSLISPCCYLPPLPFLIWHFAVVFCRSLGAQTDI